MNSMTYILCVSLRKQLIHLFCQSICNIIFASVNENSLGDPIDSSITNLITFHQYI